MIVAGNRKSRFFADGKLGGKNAALKAAKLYRDTLVARKKPGILKPRPLRVNRGSTSSYQIRMPKPGGGTTTTEFSIQRHGSTQARLLAVKAFTAAARRLKISAKGD